MPPYKDKASWQGQQDKRQGDCKRAHVTKNHEKYENMKRQKIDLHDLPSSITAAEAEDILNTVDDWESNVNPSDVLINLRSKIKVNRELRIKYSSLPQKYVESEVDLDEAIKAVTLLSGEKDSFISFIKSGGLHSLLELLDHDNTDISSEVISTIVEFTSDASVAELDGEASTLKAYLQSSGVIQKLSSFFLRLDRGNTDHQDTLMDAMDAIENVLDVISSRQSKTQAASICFSSLIDIISDSVCPITLRSRASELASSLCYVLTLSDAQMDSFNAAITNSLINRKLSIIEIEFVVSCIECLAWAALPSFTTSLSIVIASLDHKARRELCTAALRLLDATLTTFPPACNAFVEAQGLGVLFPVFMGRLTCDDEDVACEFSINVIITLLNHCTHVPLDRVKAKFRENQFEKLERLVELHAIYGLKVSEANDVLVRLGYSTDQDEVQLELGNAGLRILHGASHALACLLTPDIEDVARSLVRDKGVAKSIVQWYPSDDILEKLSQIV